MSPLFWAGKTPWSSLNPWSSEWANWEGTGGEAASPPLMSEHRVITLPCLPPEVVDSA